MATKILKRSADLITIDPILAVTMEMVKIARSKKAKVIFVGTKKMFEEMKAHLGDLGASITHVALGTSQGQLDLRLRGLAATEILALVPVKSFTWATDTIWSQAAVIGANARVMVFDPKAPL